MSLLFCMRRSSPIFLHNVLNTVVSFCYTDSERAAKLLVNLSKYLRFVFDVEQKSMKVPLERELELIRVYVEVEQARFGDLIHVEYEVDPALKYMEIPSFCIQPLVENSIKHGLCKKEAGGTVHISARKSERDIMIEVSDTGIGMSAETLDHLRNIEFSNEGVGFFNVRKRIRCWKDARLDIRSTEGEGTTVTITVSDGSV